ERFLLGFQCRLQLLEATLAEGAVGRPVRLVEGATGGVYRAVHVRVRGVRDLAQYVLGGRVDVDEPADLPIDELAVDQHPRLETNLGCVSHAARSLQTGSCRWPDGSRHDGEGALPNGPRDEGAGPGGGDCRPAACGHRSPPYAGRTAPARRERWRALDRNVRARSPGTAPSNGPCDRSRRSARRMA